MRGSLGKAWMRLSARSHKALRTGLFPTGTSTGAKRPSQVAHTALGIRPFPGAARLAAHRAGQDTEGQRGEP